MMTINLVHSFDERTNQKIDTAIWLLRRILKLEEIQVTELSDLSAQIAADAQQTKNGFQAVKTVLQTQGDKIKELTDKLAALPAGEDTGPIVAELKAVHESMTGTNAEIIAAGALANTPGAGDVPPAAAKASADAVSNI